MQIATNVNKILRVSDVILILQDMKRKYGDLPVWWTDGESQEIPICKDNLKIEPYYNESYPLRVEIG